MKNEESSSELIWERTSGGYLKANSVYPFWFKINDSEKFSFAKIHIMIGDNYNDPAYMSENFDCIYYAKKLAQKFHNGLLKAQENERR